MLKAWNNRSVNMIPTQLLWLQSDGLSYVKTDFILPSVMCPIEVDYAVMDSQQGSIWPAIVTSGAQAERSSLFKLTVWVPYSSWIWFQTGIYQLENSFSSGQRIKLLAYKVSSDKSEKVIVSYVDGISVPYKYESWTTPIDEMANTINFFAEISRSGDPYSDSICKTGRFYGCKVYDKDDHNIVLASFKPALLKGVVGVYEEISKKFYPELGEGHLLYSE